MSEYEPNRPHDPDKPDGHEPSSGRRIGGVVLMILGVVIMLPTGLCTLFFMNQDPITALVLGGAPFLIGLAIFRGGKRLMKR